MRATRGIRLALAICLLWGVAVAGCSADAASSTAKNPDKNGGVTAAPIPTHVLVAGSADSTVEQGDVIEVRLAETDVDRGPWRLERKSGDARIDAQGPPIVVQLDGAKRVFRFRALGIGSAELVFSRDSSAPGAKSPEAATFRITVR